MPCIFHVSGEKFQPEIALQSATFSPYHVYKIGEKVNRGKPGAVYSDSGFSVYVGDKNCDDLGKQIEATILFVQNNLSVLRLLTGAEELKFDFGYKPRRGEDGLTMLCQCDGFEPDFLKMCGELKIGIELSLYGIETSANP
jgi:hypothetical protein